MLVFEAEELLCGVANNLTQQIVSDVRNLTMERAHLVLRNHKWFTEVDTNAPVHDVADDPCTESV